MEDWSNNLAKTAATSTIGISLRFIGFAGTRFFQGEQAYTQSEAKRIFKATAEATDKPFVYLSAGVSNAQFIETLELLGRKRKPLQWCPLRARDLAGWHRRLRAARRRGIGRVAQHNRPGKHHARQQRSQYRAMLLPGIGREGGRCWFGCVSRSSDAAGQAL